jgi:hypothetical protein
MFNLTQSLFLVAEACRGQTRHRTDLEATLLGFCEQWAAADDRPGRPGPYNDANRATIRTICNKLFPLHPST